MLKIDNLQASIEGTQILKGIDLEVKPGEIHAIIGPNGSGKSTLARVMKLLEVALLFWVRICSIWGRKTGRAKDCS
jgi:ABC-type Mn2+/Zn2+ transport system ATPase subunit